MSKYNKVTEQNSLQVARLTKKDFADALKKGLGRASLHVSKYGLPGVEDWVLNACIHNQVYDTQCEDGRATWLFKMIRNKPEYPNLRHSILMALESETDGDDLNQLCDLAKEMAINGDKEAGKI